MRKLAYLIIIATMTTGLSAYGQGGDHTALQQRLQNQFPLTQVARNRSDFLSTGAQLQLQKGGLMMYSTESPLPPVNTYKNGRITQGGHGFGQDILITMLTPGNGTASNYPHRQFAANEDLWVSRIDVQNGGIVFYLYSDTYDNIRYYAELKFPFEKGSFPSPDQAIAKIAEVLTVQPAGNSPGNTAVVQDPQPSPTAPQLPPVQLNLPAAYVSSQSPADQLQLNADKSFSLQEGGQFYHGTFTETGEKLELSINETNTTTTVTVQGNSLADSSAHTWVLSDQKPQTATSAGTLNNQDVVKMAKAGFDDEMILAKIRNSKCQFDTSTDALIQLKHDGVSSSVIKAMVAGK